MFDPLNPFMELASDRALSATTVLQVRLQLTVNDIFDGAGSRTGCGNPQKLRESPVVHRHAVATQRLLNAGAVYNGNSLKVRRAFALTGPRHNNRDLMAWTKNINQQQQDQ